MSSFDNTWDVEPTVDSKLLKGFKFASSSSIYVAHMLKSQSTKDQLH